MFFKALKIIFGITIAAGLLYILGAVGADDFETLYGGYMSTAETTRKIAAGIGVAVGGGIAYFFTAYFEWERDQKRRRKGGSEQKK